MNRPSWKIPTRRDEDGFSLIELTIAMLLSAILMGTVLTTVDSFFHAEATANFSYAGTDKLLPVGTSFQRLLRTAVSPATGGTGAAPIPPFGTYTATHTLTPATPIQSTTLTFFSNDNTPNGPVEVIAKLSGTTFSVSTKSPKSTTCPGLKTRPVTDRCTWNTPAHKIYTVPDVANTALGKPVFQYYLSAPTNLAAGGYGTPATLTKDPFAKCTPSTTTVTGAVVKHCPAANIRSVKVDLEVELSGLAAEPSKIESQTVTYQLSTVSQTYSAAVG